MRKHRIRGDENRAALFGDVSVWQNPIASRSNQSRDREGAFGTMLVQRALR